MNETITGLFSALRLIPVVVIESRELVVPLADALAEGGLPCAEITLRTPSALDALKAFAERPGMLVGAGSVCTPDQVSQVVDAGARFVVSPGLSESVVLRCRDLGVPTLPGVATATEIMHAIELGLDVVKLFPAGHLGGPAGLRSLAAPFHSVRFVPTGGVSPMNIAEYLSTPAVLAVGGSWMVAPGLIRAGRFDEIRRLTYEAAAMSGVRP
ncbi:MAG: bifunctional 4-hydroxy-2-oxoglutarate aldolase/2-dehydro-3-deoxy-phosphogluconate aldolase [Acidimicrobiales bacterium]